MHHLYKTKYLNHNHFGFIPQNSTKDAAVTVKQFIGPELERRRVVVITSLDVKGAFDAAWWPAILRGLRKAECPRNLYQLTQGYFKVRRMLREEYYQRMLTGVMLWARELDYPIQLTPRHKIHPPY